MEDDKVDLDERTVWLGGKKFWYEHETDGNGDRIRVWYRESKTLAYLNEPTNDGDDHAQVVPIAEIRKLEASRGYRDGPIDWTPVERRVKDRARIEQLNEIVNRAKKLRRKKERQREKERGTTHKVADRGEAEQGKQSETKDRAERFGHRLDTKAESPVEAGPRRRGSRHQSAVNFALKSAASDYVLNFRAAPSKKQKDLYNVSVHLGSKFLGYVEVPVEQVVELGHRLAGVSRAASDAAD